MSTQQQYAYQQIVNLINGNRLNEAENLLSQIISTEPLSFQASFQLAYIRHMQGRMEDAKKLLLKSLGINPNFEQAKQFLARLEEMIPAINNFNPEPDAIYAHWYNQMSNWGDVLNIVLIEKLSGKKIIWVASFDYRVPVKYLVIGSTLRHMDANTIVWGAGAMSEEYVPAVEPKKICAVRGPLTRQFLIKRGIDCPEIYGDPGLLYPRFYDPEVKQQYDIGIVAHYVDQKHPWLKSAEAKGAKIINILGDINQVVDDIKSCKRIASSSLHGIIAADAYGIPSTWIEFSDDVLGNGFKFRDYYQSINRPAPVPVRINNDTNIEELDEGFNLQGIDIDLDLLLNSCPFMNANSINEER